MDNLNGLLDNDKRNRREIKCLAKTVGKFYVTYGGCGKEAARGCEVRIDAGHGGDHITIPGDLIVWCESHEKNLLEVISHGYMLLDIAQLRAGYVTRSDKRGRAT